MLFVVRWKEPVAVQRSISSSSGTCRGLGNAGFAHPWKRLESVGRVCADTAARSRADGVILAPPAPTGGRGRCKRGGKQAQAFLFGITQPLYVKACLCQQGDLSKTTSKAC